MATKTEDSLVFSWEGRDIYHFSFRIYFGQFSLERFTFRFDFHFRDSFSEFHFRLAYLYISAIHISSSPPFRSHFDAFGQFSLYSQKTLPWRDIFASRDTFANATKPEVFGYDESL